MEKELIISSVTKDLEIGKIFAESGIFPDIKSAAQGYVKILAGREIGLSPVRSLNAFYIVNNRLSVSADVFSGLIKKSKKYDFKIDVHTDQECSISFFEIMENGNKEKIGESKFTLKMAARAGIVNKENWKNYPENMLFSRALMNGVRWYCPDVMLSSATIYTVDEMEDIEPTKQTTTTILEFDNKGNQNV